MILASLKGNDIQQRRHLLRTADNGYAVVKAQFAEELEEFI